MNCAEQDRPEKAARSFSRSRKSALASAGVTSSKPHDVVRLELGRGPEIDGDHVRNLGITADRLAIPEQQNRLPVVRHLHGPWGDRFGEQLPLVFPSELRALQPHTHPVRLRADRECGLQKCFPCFLLKLCPFRAAHDAQNRNAHRGQRPLLWRAPGRDSAGFGGKSGALPNESSSPSRNARPL